MNAARVVTNLLQYQRALSHRELRNWVSREKRETAVGMRYYFVSVQVLAANTLSDFRREHLIPMILITHRGLLCLVCLSRQTLLTFKLWIITPVVNCGGYYFRERNSNMKVMHLSMLCPRGGYLGLGGDFDHFFYPEGGDMHKLWNCKQPQGGELWPNEKKSSPGSKSREWTL